MVMLPFGEILTQHHRRFAAVPQFDVAQNIRFPRKPFASIHAPGG
jgi:hypothetical protein